MKSVSVYADEISPSTLVSCLGELLQAAVSSIGASYIDEVSLEDSSGDALESRESKGRHESVLSPVSVMTKSQQTS